VAVAGCAGDTDGADGSPSYLAEQLVIAQSNASTSAMIRAAAGSTVASPCTRAGTVAVTGAVAPGAPDAVFDIYVDFAGCVDRNPGTDDASWDEHTDGRVRWTSAAAPTGFAQTVSGDVHYAGRFGELACHLELQLAVDPDGAQRYAGTACGLDVATLFDQ
jgi:hypothetical protein